MIFDEIRWSWETLLLEKEEIKKYYIVYFSCKYISVLGDVELNVQTWNFILRHL